MKKILFIMMALMMALTGSAKKTVNIRWCTFNIRLLTEADRTINCHWDQRKERVVKFVTKNKLDIVGMQEVTHPQLEYLNEKLGKNYDYVGVGRTDGKTKGEYSPIFFNRAKYEVLDKGNFWLSETPDAVGVKGWDAAIERIATWVKFRDKKTGKIFMAVNTHFDHVGKVARKESAKLIMEKIQQIVEYDPAVVTGDFNITENDEAYHTMTTNRFKMKDAYHVTDCHKGATHTFHSFCRIDRQDCEKIDFIFVTPNIHVKNTYIELENPKKQLSDHNPHWADLEF